MADNIWRPQGFKIKIQGVPYDPILALRNFVLPIKHNPNWIEDSSKVTNTGLSAREWFGLVIHALSLSDKTGDYFRVSTENTGSDGSVVRDENSEQLAVVVEQTLATYREDGDLMDVIRRRIENKSSKRKPYAENKHLVVLCNKPGDLRQNEVAQIVAKSEFDIVNVIALTDSQEGRHYICFLFDADNAQSAVHICPITESKLWQAAIDIYDNEQVTNQQEPNSRPSP